MEISGARALVIGTTKAIIASACKCDFAIAQFPSDICKSVSSGDFTIWAVESDMLTKIGWYTHGSIDCDTSVML